MTVDDQPQDQQQQPAQDPDKWRWVALAQLIVDVVSIAIVFNQCG